MKANWFAITVILVGVIVIWSAWPTLHRRLDTQSPQPTSVSDGYGRGAVEFSDSRVNVTIPLTLPLQERGLGERTSLGADDGMLFIYTTPGYPIFWMKHMRFALDFVWLDHGQVVDITADVPAPADGQVTLPTYQPDVPASAVLEVRAGYAARHHISVGDAAKIDRY
ncbi:MAG: DUF192 domain-containing protein [Candidatus Kerfeldbacteria bacterium]|nr:DUF192 domain-containing protein [Candidatus Kerfeldbacteria bacterium]